MNHNRIIKSSILAILLITLVACKKEPGQGGRCTIKGKVKVKDYNSSFTALMSEYYAQGENVYIIYGDNSGVSDKTKTSYDGSYEFPYLRNGKYKIFVVSKDTTTANLTGQVSIVKEVDLNLRKQTAIVPDITIIN